MFVIRGRMVFHGGNGQYKTVIYQYKQFIERPIYSDTTCMLENTGHTVSKILISLMCLMEMPVCLQVQELYLSKNLPKEILRKAVMSVSTRCPLY